ncbi:MAG: hypothetical protein E7342_00145 [Clostridiales bacterium]|nr:hypothetical protein [Clostridiales bacterium]
MNKSKVETYIGFSMRARKCKLGVNAIATLKKAHLLILCKTASENTKKDAVKLAKRLNAKLIITVSKELSEYTHVENGKLIAILDFELAKAILENACEDFIYYVMEA